MQISTLFSVQAQMFLMMGAGFLLRKLRIINDNGTQCLSDIVMYVLLPCSIACAYFDSDPSILLSFFWIAVISTMQQLFTYGVSLIFWRGYPQERRAVLRYSIQFSNSGFIGLPITKSFYGTEGLLYASIFTLPIQVFMWTTGLPAFIRSKTNPVTIAKNIFLHPCMVATYIGFFIMFVPLHCPEFLFDAMSGFSNSLTPVSMLLIGSILVDANLKSMLSKDIILLSLFRLLVVPMVVLLFSLPFHLPAMAIRVSTLLAGMPVGSVTAILAVSYRCDEVLASNCIVFSTLLSLFTLPLVYLILQLLD